MAGTRCAGTGRGCGERYRGRLHSAPVGGRQDRVYPESNQYGFILGLKSDYSDKTWVAVDFDGNVTVNISHQDYMEYKESLAFDQLCAALANLFVEFMDSSHQGQGVRIIDRMDALGISFFHRVIIWNSKPPLN